MEKWAEIATFPVCPVQALEEVLVEKEIKKKDLANLDELLDNLKKHEQELRDLRQEIDRKVRQIKMELYKDNM
jgi:chromosome segregation ATPase